ncbi:MAG: TMEM165/GDT1 family protein [Halobaculum sp.]
MEFWTIVVVAAIAQLTVLPGEKVQFIIAGLSTRYSPALVVGAAGTAFAGWTAVEIAFGQAVQNLLPGIVLDVLTAGLFLVFAVLLFRSAPEDGEIPASTDGGVAGVESVDRIDREFEVGSFSVGGPVGRFLTIFAMMAAGEFGDKTQLVTIALAVDYGATPAIWLGEMAVIVPVSLANAYFFHTFSHRFDVRKAHYAGAAIFAFFGLNTVLSITTGFSVWETVVGTVSEVLLALV